MKNIKKIFAKNHIEIQDGLSEKEIELIESIYRIRFPHPLKEFYMSCLPVGTGFYNWRNFDDNNLSAITSMLELPRKNLSKNLDWYNELEGDSHVLEDRMQVAKHMIETVPPLIPVFSHRYMPACELKEYPIISVHGIDVIYYGSNLYEYFEIEFGEKKQSEIVFSAIEYIPFWSDIM